MALKLGSLYVSLSAQTSGFAKGMAGALKDLERFSKEAKRVSSEVAMFSGVLAGMGVAAVKLASSVDGPTKQAMGALEKSTQLLAVQVADMLLPAVREMTSLFKSAASVVAGLDPEVKKQISTFAVMAVQVAVAAKAFSFFSGLAATVFGVLRGGFAMLASVGAGPLLSIAIGVGLVIGAVLLLHRAWRKNWGGIQDATGEVLEWLRGAFSQLGTFFGKVWDFLVDGAARFVDGLLAVVDVVQKITGKKLVDTGGLREGFGGLWKDLKSGSFFSEAFSFGKSIGTQLVDGIKEEWAAIGELGFDGPRKGATIALGRGMGSASSARDPSGHEFAADESMRVAALLAAGALRDMSAEVATFKKSLADVDFAQEVKKWLQQLNSAPTTSMRGGLASVSLSDRNITSARFGGRMSAAGGDAEKKAAREQDIISSAVGAADWGEAQKILEGGLDGAASVGATLEVWGKRMSGIFARAGQDIFGAVGSLVASIAEGAQQGGVWGAIIAAIMEVVKTAASALEFLGTAMNFVKQLGAMIEPMVKPIFDALTDVLGIVSVIIVPIFKALGGLFKIIADIVSYLTPILVAIGDLFEAVAPILDVIFSVVGGILEILKPIFALIGGVIKVIASVILGFIIFLNEIAAALGDTQARAEADRMNGIINNMWAPGHEERVLADGKAAGAALRNADAQNEAADAAQKVAESLTNVPAGFNIANARYQADMGITSAGAFSGGGAGGGGGVTINGDVNVTSTADSMTGVASDAAKASARARGQRTGNSRGREASDND